MPETYEFEGETRRIRTFLEETDTSGFLVLKDGEIVHEEYALGSSRETRWIFWSVAKRFVSARRMEEDAYWITDEAGMEFAFGGLNATLRDYARFGEPELRQRRNDGSRDRITRPVQRDRAIDRPLNTIRFDAVLASTQP